MELQMRGVRAWVIGLVATANIAMAEIDIAGYPPGAHPLEDYSAAVARFNAGDQLTAGCLFYRGQYRYRVHLAARPDLPPDGDPALMGALNEQVGRPINEWLGGNKDDWLAAMDCAIGWAEANDDAMTPRAQFPQAHAEVLSGFVDFRDSVAAMDPAELRAQRDAAGLPNR
jgi:hypothetical protein